MAWQLQIGNPVQKTLRFYYKGTNNPYNLTGKTLLYSFKLLSDNARNDNAAIIKGSITEHTDATAGLSLLDIDDTETTKLKPGLYKVDFRILGEGIKRNTWTKTVTAIQVVTEREE